MHLAASVRIVGPGPSGNRALDPVLQRRAATSVVGLCGTPSTSLISGVGCAETRGSLHPVHQLRRLAVRIHTPILSIHGCTYSIIGAGKSASARILYRWPRLSLVS